MKGRRLRDESGEGMREKGSGGRIRKRGVGCGAGRVAERE